MSEKIKTDLRVIKTKRAIRAAFSRLLSSKEFGAITVKDIADSAEVNRKTFYSYYTGVAEIASEFEDEVAAAFGSALSELDLSASITGAPREIFKKLSAVIDANSEFYRLIMKTSRAANMLKKLMGELGEKIKVQLSGKSEGKGKPLELAADFAAAGIITAYQKWFDSDRSQTIDDISVAVGQIAFTGLGGIMLN
jgi:Transcriptional regulator